MADHTSLVGRLLAYAAACGPPLDWDWGEVEGREFEWVISAGLGPMLYRATLQAQANIPKAWRDALLASDLTARVRHANLVDMAVDILEACRRAGIPCTLLKGISTSEQFYPSPHLRPMGDIDVLVAPDACGPLESALVASGCRRHDEYVDDPDEHHGPPLYHAGRDVWIEIHRSLFPNREELCESPAFGIPNVDANSVTCTFHGLPARRLGAELQLVYIAGSWMRDITISKIEATFLASLFDAILLLRTEARTLDWAKLGAWSGDDMATASLHVLLQYLDHRALCRGVDPQTAHDLAIRQRLVGPLSLRAIHAVVDRYLIAGRRWDHVLPPPIPGRYNLRRQWKKRIAHRGRQP